MTRGPPIQIDLDSVTEARLVAQALAGAESAYEQIVRRHERAVLTLLVRLTGDAFYNPSAMTDGFHTGMLACAGLSVVGGVLAWLTISDDVLEAEPQPEGGTPDRLGNDYMCPVSGAPLRPAREAECQPPAADEVAVTSS